MKKTKIITSAGLFVAIYALFFIVSRSTGGFLESMLFFLLPIPLAVFTINYGLKYAIIPFVSILAIGFFINPISTLFYVLTANVLGVIYGALVRKGVNSKILCIISIITSCLVEVLATYVFAKMLNYDVNAEIKDIFALILKIFRLVSEDELIMNNLIFAAIPLFVFCMGFLEGFVTHVFATLVLTKLKIRENTIGNIYKMRLGILPVILYIVFLVLHALTMKIYYTNDSGFLYWLSYGFLEIFWALALVFFAKGYLYFALKMARKSIGKPLIIIVVIGMVLIPIPIILIISILGVISVFSDKRKYLLYNE